MADEDTGQPSFFDRVDSYLGKKSTTQGGLDTFFASPGNMGLLSAAAALMKGGRASRMPITTGEALGDAGGAAIQGAQAGTQMLDTNQQIQQRDLANKMSLARYQAMAKRFPQYFGSLEGGGVDATKAPPGMAPAAKDGGGGESTGGPSIGTISPDSATPSLGTPSASASTALPASRVDNVKDDIIDKAMEADFLFPGAGKSIMEAYQKPLPVQQAQAALRAELQKSGGKETNETLQLRSFIAKETQVPPVALRAGAGALTYNPQSGQMEPGNFTPKTNEGEVVNYGPNGPSISMAPGAMEANEVRGIQTQAFGQYTHDHAAWVTKMQASGPQAAGPEPSLNQYLASAQQMIQARQAPQQQPAQMPRPVAAQPGATTVSPAQMPQPQMAPPAQPQPQPQPAPMPPRPMNPGIPTPVPQAPMPAPPVTVQPQPAPVEEGADTGRNVPEGSIRTKFGTFIPPVSSQPPIPSATDERAAKLPVWAKKSEAITESINPGQQAEQRLHSIADAYKTLETGTFTSDRAKLAAGFRGLGMNGLADKILSSDSTVAAQTALHDNYTETMQQLKNSTSRWTQMEFKVMSAAKENPDLSPQANLQMIAEDLGTVRSQLHLAYDWTAAQNPALGGWKNPEAFETTWRQANPNSAFVKAARAEIGPLKGMNGAGGNSAPAIPEPPKGFTVIGR